MLAFVSLVLSCMFGTALSDILFNHIDISEAFHKAANSLPTTMLIAKTSTLLTKWMIQISHFYILGGILMIHNFRNALVRDIHLIIAYEPEVDTKEQSEWV